MAEANSGRPGTFVAWLYERDVAKVKIGDWPAATPMVDVTYRSGVHKAMAALAVGLAVGFGVVLVAVGQWPVSMLPLLLSSLLLLPQTYQWTDQLVGPAVARAVRQLGTETSPGHWKITGIAARELMGEVRRVKLAQAALEADGTTPSGLDHERAAIEAAGPLLRRQLRPVLSGDEHHNEPLEIADEQQLKPGDPWPMLNQADPQWTQPGRPSPEG